jgi:hypothetical protein
MLTGPEKRFESKSTRACVQGLHWLANEYHSSIQAQRLLRATYPHARSRLLRQVTTSNAGELGHTRAPEFLYRTATSVLRELLHLHIPNQAQRPCIPFFQHLHRSSVTIQRELLHQHVPDQAAPTLH